MICPFCKWDWKARVDEPKCCPRCKRRLDTPWNIRQSEPEKVSEP